MAITNSFRNDVSSKNILGVRIMMKDSLLLDPSFNEFNAMEDAAKSIDGLYDIHDGCEFFLDKSTWTDDYMNKLMVQVVDNFSKERIDHLKEVVRYLRPVSVSKESPNNNTKSNMNVASASKRKVSFEEQNSSGAKDGIITNRNSKIIAGAAVGSVVGGTIVGIVGSSILLGAASGAVVVGALTAILTKDR